MNPEDTAVMTEPWSRRSLIALGLTLASGAAAAAESAGAPAARPAGPAPWVQRFFHLYTGTDGRSRAEIYPVRGPATTEMDTLLRRTAARVTIGMARPGAGFDFHVANQPTLLVPIYGTTIIGLADGTKHEFGHGDIAFAEDCTGQGHTSYAGAEGCFMIYVQLPKPLCPAVGSSDMTSIWRD